MRTTITTELDFEGFSIEVDGDYWRGEDEAVTDLTLCRFTIHAETDTNSFSCFDILQGLDRPARLVIERNLFAMPGLVKQLIEDIQTQGDDLQLELDYDPHTKDD